MWRPGREQLELVATLLEAGVRLDVALETLAAAAAAPATRQGAAHAASTVRSGASLSSVLAELGASRHVVALVDGGERSGRLIEALRGAAHLVGHLERMRATVLRALVYPGLVLGIGIAMAIVIAVVIVPGLERTFVDLGGELPLPTRLVVAAAAGVRRPAVRLLLVATIATLVLARRRGLTSGRGWVPGRTLLLRLPIVRGVAEDLDVSVVATLLSTMLRARIPLVDALRTAREAVGPGRRRTAIERSLRSMRSGGPAIAADGLGEVLLPTEREMLAVAEQGGAIERQWERVAAMRRERLEARVERLGSILEPLLVLAVGLLVGGIVLALYLPTFRVLQLL